MDRRQVEDRLVRVLQKATSWLPVEQLVELESLVRAGEPGVALENFCAQLEEDDVVVPVESVRELNEIAAAMGMAMPWTGRSADRPG